MNRFIFLLLITLGVLSMMYQGCKSCNCGETPTHFKLIAEQADGFVFGWEAGVGERRVRIELRDLLDNSTYSKVFSQSGTDPNTALIKFADAEDFFQVGHYYDARIKRDCEDLPCSGDESSPYSTPLLLHYVPNGLEGFRFEIIAGSDPCNPTFGITAPSADIDGYILYRKAGDRNNNKSVIEAFEISKDKTLFQCPSADSSVVYSYFIVGIKRNRAANGVNAPAIGEVPGCPNCYITSCCVSTVEDNIGITDPAEVSEIIRDCIANTDGCLPMNDFATVEATTTDLRINIYLPAFECNDTTKFRVLLLSPDLTKAYFTEVFEVPATSRGGDYFFFHSYNPDGANSEYKMMIVPSLGERNLLCR